MSHNIVGCIFMSNRIYVITGANGHLGGTIVRMLRRGEDEVRGFVLTGSRVQDRDNVTYYQGDVRNKETLRPLFEHTDGREIVVIHTAGMIDISEKVSPRVYDVNVQGTKNVVSLCEEYRVKRLVYVSSVHAIPEGEKGCVLEETYDFSPDKVHGGYAKTKAEATAAVLAAVREQGLDAVVVHPSGIIGPYDDEGNHLVQLIGDYIKKRLPACVRGGYDFVDVRDVAKGCLSAVDHGRKGNCYILSNRHYEVKDVLDMTRHVCGGRKLPVLPMWMAKAGAPILEGVAKVRKERPLYTKYSLYTLTSNDRFSHDKATMELGYRPRDLRMTVADTVRWLTRKRCPVAAR